MKQIAYLLLVVTMSTSACKTLFPGKKRQASPQETCESSPNHVWFHNSCQSRKVVQPQMDCEAKGPDYTYVNSDCIKGYARMTPQQKCETALHGAWVINQDGIAQCVVSGNDSAIAECESRPGYLWTEGACVSPEGQKCHTNGGVWYQESCITGEQKDCIDRADGSTWSQDRCISRAEQDCLRNRYQKWSAGPNNTFTCIQKTFTDYCTDQNPAADIKVTVAALFAIAGYSQTSTSPNDCAAVNLQLSQNMVDFDLSTQGIQTLAPLSSFTNLQGLNLQGNDISDISFLSSLKSLQRLNLSSNNIIDISALEKLNLSSLTLNANLIADLSPLAKSTTLTDLYVTDNKLTSLDSLLDSTAMARGGLAMLTNMGLANNCNLKSVDGVVKLPALKWLGLEGVGVTQAAVESLKKLNPKLSVDFTPCQ